MNAQLKTQLDRAFALTRDLVIHLDEPALGLDLPDLPSNRISAQLWCMVGARESYTAGIKAGAWQGFTCSLETPRIKESVITSLETSHQLLSDTAFTHLTDPQLRLAFDLLEHEIQHHGQLIRFIYANRLTFPKSWNERYTV